MRRLLLLRHAKAEPAGNGPDFDRGLAGRGLSNARAMGAYIAEHALLPDFAAVSPARRTVETWELVAAELKAPCKPVFDARLYGASEETLLAVVRAIPAKHQSAMLVGHNPGLERLAQVLAGAGSKRARQTMDEKFPTAALAVIDFDIEDWRRAAPEQGVLKLFVTPASLAAADK